MSKSAETYSLVTATSQVLNMPQDVFELPAPEGNTIVGHLLDLSNDPLGLEGDSYAVTKKPQGL